MNDKICVGVNDDYASLTIGEHTHYYGYEVTDPKTEEWCYQWEYNGKTVTIPASALDKGGEKHEDCAHMLLLGIGNTLYRFDLVKKVE